MFRGMRPLGRIYRGLVLPARFNGHSKPVPALVDSGADKTLVSKKLIYNIIPRDIRENSLEIRTKQGPRVVTATNSPIKIVGFVSGLEMRVGDLNGTVSLNDIPIVEGLTPDVILGHETLQQLNASITFQSQGGSASEHNSYRKLFEGGGGGGGGGGSGSGSKSGLKLPPTNSQVRLCSPDGSGCKTYNMDAVRQMMLIQQKNASKMQDGAEDSGGEEEEYRHRFAANPTMIHISRPISGSQMQTEDDKYRRRKH